MASIIALDPQGRVVMRRDMNLVRDVLREIQSRQDLEERPVIIDGRDEIVVGHHVEMLYEAGFIDGINAGARGRPYSEILVKDLSWTGHDFIGVLENEGVWNKIKQSFSAAELTTIPLSVLKDVGLGLLKQYAMEKVGLSG